MCHIHIYLFFLNISWLLLCLASLWGLSCTKDLFYLHVSIHLRAIVIRLPTYLLISRTIFSKQGDSKLP